MVLSADHVVEGRGLSKAYGPSRALVDVDFTISRGSVHGLLGKNGAGKSTLAGIVAGTTRPDAGTLTMDDQDITGQTTAARRRHGIRLLGQHSEVLDDLTVAENLLLADLPRPRGVVSWRAAFRSAEWILREHSLDVSPKARASELSLSERRRLSIVKVLVGDGRLIVLDEPTTGLSLDERRDLLRWIRSLADTGVTFVYISHHNDEVRQLCTEYTVLRDGAVVSAGSDVAELSSGRLSALVTGDDVDEFHRRRRNAFGRDVLELEGFAAGTGRPFDLRVGEGEVVGLIGLPRSGAQETMRALAGLVPCSGVVRVDGTPVRCDRPRRALAAGISYLTYDRMAEGLVPEMSIADNVHLGRWPVRRGGLLQVGESRRATDRSRRELGIRMGNPTDEVRTLSGGNAQKVLLSRLLDQEPRVLLLDEPTVGVDVGAKEDIHRLIDAASERGIGVVVRAYDPEETVRLVDRAVTFAGGTVSGELAGDALTVDAVSTAQHIGGTRV